MERTLKFSSKMLEIGAILNNPISIKILKYVKNHDCTITEISNNLPMDYRSIHNYLDKLLDIGIINKVKKGKVAIISYENGKAKKMLEGWKKELDKIYGEDLKDVKD